MRFQKFPDDDEDAAPMSAGLVVLGCVSRERAGTLGKGDCQHRGAGRKGGFEGCRGSSRWCTLAGVIIVIYCIIRSVQRESKKKGYCNVTVGSHKLGCHPSNCNEGSFFGTYNLTQIGIYFRRRGRMKKYSSVFCSIFLEESFCFWHTPNLAYWDVRTQPG